MSINYQNLSKEKLLAEVERLKKELKNRKKYGLVWEEKPEEVVEMCKIGRRGKYVGGCNKAFWGRSC